MMRRKDFIDWFNTETDFTRLRGVMASEAKRRELREMHNIYSRTKTDAEFTEAMHRAGYGVIE